MGAINFNKTYLVTGIIACLICIVLGAFGAHALKAMLGPSEIATWKLGTEYQFMHGLALILLSLFHSIESKLIKWSYIAFLLGILLFSGSLYLLTFKSVLLPSALSIIGPLTPIGGILLILGWLFFLLAIFKHQK